MSVLLFRLRNVPEDEAGEIRELLSVNHLEFYETSAGIWGISSPAIWLKDNDDHEHAKALLDKYQKQRAMEQREVYEHLKKSGKDKKLFHSFIENPVRFILYLLLVIFIVYVSTSPFLL